MSSIKELETNVENAITAFDTAMRTHEKAHTAYMRVYRMEASVRIDKELARLGRVRAEAGKVKDKAYYNQGVAEETLYDAKRDAESAAREADLNEIRNLLEKFRAADYTGGDFDLENLLG